MEQVRHVVLNMLKDRGYKVPESETDIYAFMNAEEYLTYKVAEEDKKAYVFFPKMPKVGVGTIRNYVKEMEENEVQHSVIVVKETITAFAKQVFVEARPLVIEYFTEEELLIDKTTHSLVPKHELISNQEKKDILKMYKCTKDTQLPWILRSDPIARHYEAKKGQVFKITRTSETAGKHVTYRIVV